MPEPPPAPACRSRVSCSASESPSTECRKDLFEFVRGSRAAVLIQLERLGVADAAPLLLAVQLDEQSPVLSRYVGAALFDGLEQKCLASRFVSRHVRAISRLPRVPVRELRRHVADAVPLLLRDLVEAHGNDRVEGIRLLELVRIEKENRITFRRRRGGRKQRRRP